MEAILELSWKRVLMFTKEEHPSRRCLQGSLFLLLYRPLVYRHKKTTGTSEVLLLKRFNKVRPI